MLSAVFIGTRVHQIQSFAKKQKAECRENLSTQHLILLGSFKTQEAGSLETQLSPVTLQQIANLVIRNLQFQPVAALELKGSIMYGLRRIIGVLGMVPLGHHRGLHRQPGRMVVLVPLAYQKRPSLHDEPTRHRSNC